MLVFGDVPRREPPQALLAALAQALRDTAAMPPGIVRHGALVDAFLAAGELAQGLADAEFEQRGHDAPSPLQDAAMALLMCLARAIGLSWSSAFTCLPPLPEPVLPASLPATIALKHAEGFAFYALYPEAYLDATARAGLGPQTRVIGLRSIGAPLASLVASALGAAPPVTLRPVGHPFGRQLALSPPAAAALLDCAGDFAIVDEGPGLSGSSMGAVADFLEDRGVAPGRLHFFPSHAGAPGPRASARHRARWQAAPRHLTSFDALVLEAPEPRHRLPAWVADLTGPAEAPLRDISGGGWRALRYATEAAWPAVNPQQERRKFLLRAGGRPWLLKFTGLGADAARQACMADALGEAGLSPPVAGRRHGFLVQEWLPDARGLDQCRRDPAALLAPLVRYLGFRARHCPAGPGAGAPLSLLWEMACHNAAEALGEAAGCALRRLEPDLPRLEARLRRIATDNRLHPWEWLSLPDGRLLKSDAVDHHAGHDLLGCQDLAWDIVGAAVELGMDAETLRAALEQDIGRPISPALLRLYGFCYLAFQTGACTMAAAACGAWPAEAARLTAAAARYAARLRRLIGRCGA